MDIKEPYFDYYLGSWVVDGSPVLFWEWVYNNRFIDTNIVTDEGVSDGLK